MIEVKLPSGRIIETLERSDFSAHRALMAGTDYARRDAIHDRRVDALESAVDRKADAVPMTQREIERRLLEAMRLRVTAYIKEKHRGRQRGRVDTGLVVLIASVAFFVISVFDGFMAWYEHINRLDAAPHVAPPVASSESIPPPLPFYTTITVDTGKYRRTYQVHNPGGHIEVWEHRGLHMELLANVDLDTGDVK